MFREFSLAPFIMPDPELDLLDVTFGFHEGVLDPLEIQDLLKKKMTHDTLEGLRVYHAKNTWEAWCLFQITEPGWNTYTFIRQLFYAALLEQRRIEMKILNNQLSTGITGVFGDEKILYGVRTILENNIKTLWPKMMVDVVELAELPAADIVSHLVFMTALCLEKLPSNGQDCATRLTVGLSALNKVIVFV